ncbi:Hypothetical predicted protein [Mytilus galloprovincialis]|uniref:C-type lectin domain-containing protein n=1 Tax=Mytilus galloprovincialis TaxID=29158 RepID=A0A8B6EJV7_MYTGA|nr:Hypothetical predicted protein [Mytilus galloprovincialis]
MALCSLDSFSLPPSNPQIGAKSTQKILEIGLPGPPGKQGAQGMRGQPGQAGTPGSKGYKGDHGKTGRPAGPPGQIGPIGHNGAPGMDGADGPPGAYGSKGEPGETGPRGPSGLSGITGPPGPSGPRGPSGSTGKMGPPGLKGAKGYSGDTGDQGSTGPSGEDGPTGPAEPTGPKGDTGSPGPGANCQWPMGTYACPTGFSEIPAGSKNCYYTCDTENSWLGAVFECRAQGAYLWEPNTQTELTDVGQVLDGKADRYWTGASDQTAEGAPSFELGSLGALTLSADSNGVNSDCVAYEPGNDLIYRTCHTQRKCVCEIQIPCAEQN